MVVAGVIAAVAAVGSAAVSASAADKAADKKAAELKKARGVQDSVYQNDKSNLDPYIQRGNTAGTTFNALLGIGGDRAAADNAFSQYRDSTGFRFRMDQGSEALRQGAAVNGQSQSGAAAKALMRYGQDYASGEFGNYLGYVDNQQKLGLNAAGTLANRGAGYANSMSSIYDTLGSTRANSELQQGAAWSDAISSLGSIFGMGMGGGGSSYGQVGSAVGGMFGGGGSGSYAPSGFSAKGAW